MKVPSPKTKELIYTVCCKTVKIKKKKNLVSYERILIWVSDKPFHFLLDFLLSWNFVAPLYMVVQKYKELRNIVPAFKKMEWFKEFTSA